MSRLLLSRDQNWQLKEVFMLPLPNYVIYSPFQSNTQLFIFLSYLNVRYPFWLEQWKQTMSFSRCFLTALNKIKLTGIIINRFWYKKKNTHTTCNPLQYWSARKHPFSILKQLGSGKNPYQTFHFYCYCLCVTIIYK